MNEQINLNTDLLIEADGASPLPLSPGGGCFSGEMEVHFSGIEDVLAREIQNAGAVFGVVAWLTNERLLDELAAKEVASIIVQKEDFLRPESLDKHPTKERLRSKYGAVKGGWRFDKLPAPIHGMSCALDATIEGVRCAGVYDDYVRVHHKFAVFARHIRGGGDYDQCDAYEPYAVATGSYNWTNNANRSRENLVLIHNPDVAECYFKEWAQICAISESLDWEWEYIEPQWRIGT